MVGEQAVKDGILAALEAWWVRNADRLERRGLDVTIAWGPEEYEPRSGWIDLEALPRSARLVVWSDGEAELAAGDLETLEVFRDEHLRIVDGPHLDATMESILRLLLPAGRDNG